MSSYYSMTLYICCCRVEEPYLEVMATVFFLSWGQIIKKTNFLVLEMSLLHCYAITKEIDGGGGTSGILYNLLPKVTNQREAKTHTQHVASTSMVGLIIHHKHQEGKFYIIPHP